MRTTSEILPALMTALATGVARVRRHWNRITPRTTLNTLAFFGVAPPIRIAAMAGNAIISGAE